MDLVHCIYCSASTAREFSTAELSALLETCRRSNATRDITGMLLYQNGSFLQVLEGDRTIVEHVFAKIETDPRHKRVTKMILESIDERAFGSWSMGYPRVTSKELAAIPGLNDFFRRVSSHMEIGEGRAKTLLAAFKEGQWRARLS